MTTLNKKLVKNLARMRRDIVPYMIPWWNDRAGRLGFPPIPDDWTSWPEVNPEPEEGARDKRCFWNAQYINIEHGFPLVVGVHFSRRHVLQMMEKADPTYIPYSHAANLDNKGRIVDLTWGHGQMVGLMVGRAFGVAPRNLKIYCMDRGFTK